MPRQQPLVGGMPELGPSELGTAPSTRPAGPVRRARAEEPVGAIEGARKPLYIDPYIQLRKGVNLFAHWAVTPYSHFKTEKETAQGGPLPLSSSPPADLPLKRKVLAQPGGHQLD